MNAANLRIGIGYDNHRLADGLPLMVGGVEIPSDKGAEAHSDGDVLLHSLVDALLGAIAEGDIGTHFSDRDPQWKGQDSRFFLEKTAEMVAGRGYSIVNLDSVIILEQIRIGDRKLSIRKKIQEILKPWFDLPLEAISVKAKTNEKVDAIGEGRAIGAQAIVLLNKK